MAKYLSRLVLHTQEKTGIAVNPKEGSGGHVSVGVRERQQMTECCSPLPDESR